MKMYDDSDGEPIIKQVIMTNDYLHCYKYPNFVATMPCYALGLIDHDGVSSVKGLILGEWGYFDIEDCTNWHGIIHVNQIEWAEKYLFKKPIKKWEDITEEEWEAIKRG